MSDLLAVTGTTASLIGAFAGFAGGIVGAIAAESLRSRAGAKRNGRLLRAAILRVEDELRNAHDAAAAVLTGEPFAQLPTLAWDDNSIRLAGELHEDDWRVLAQAYDRIQGFNWRLEAGVLEANPTERNEVCEKIIRDAGAGRDLLHRALANRGATALRATATSSSEPASSDAA